MGAVLVIADDLTGAAEIGGIATQYGVKTKICHHLDDLEQDGLQIINTNTRSLQSSDILDYLQTLFLEKIDIHIWDWVFLKFDSAMRGEIGLQLEFFKDLFSLQQLLFCPINPSLGRVIRNGKYYVGEVEISRSDFAHDPEFPVLQSSVKQLLGVNGVSLVNRTNEINVEMTYIVPSIASDQDLDLWAGQLHNFKLFAGAGAYFKHLLTRYLDFIDPLPEVKIAFDQPMLYICGSKHEDITQRLSRVPKDQILYWRKPADEKKLASKLTEIINRRGVAVFSAQPQEQYQAITIRKSMGLTVKFLQEQCHIQELIIEGGATAHAVLEQMNIDVLRPTEQLSQGVTRCQVAGSTQRVTMKPGSYPWSRDLWVF